jgi:hypothetical protein
MNVPSSPVRMAHRSSPSRSFLLAPTALRGLHLDRPTRRAHPQLRGKAKTARKNDLHHGTNTISYTKFLTEPPGDGHWAVLVQKRAGSSRESRDPVHAGHGVVGCSVAVRRAVAARAGVDVVGSPAAAAARHSRAGGGSDRDPAGRGAPPACGRHGAECASDLWRCVPRWPRRR